MAHPPTSGGSAGVNSFTGPPESLDNGPDRVKAKPTGKHESKDVTTTEGKPLVGRSLAHGTSQPAARRLLDRNAQSYDQLDHAGLVPSSSGPNDGDIDMDAMLNQQMRDKFGGQPVPKPPASAPTGGGSQPSAPDSTTPSPSQPPSGHPANPVPPSPVADGSGPATATAAPAPSAAKANVQIQTTEEVEGEAQKVQETQEKLAGKLSFLDKIPHKKNIAFMGIGSVLLAAGLALFPAGLVVASVGMMFIATSAAYLLHDANSPGDDAPPPPPPDGGKKKEDDGKKPDDGSKPAVPGDFLALENPDFQQAPQSSLNEDEARRLAALRKNNNGGLTPPQVHDLAKDLVTTESELPLSTRVSQAVAPLLVKAGFNPDMPESWEATNAMLATLKKSLEQPDADEEKLAQEMLAATKELLRQLHNLDIEALMAYRQRAVALATLPNLPARAVQVLHAQVEAIDERIQELKTEAELALVPHPQPNHTAPQSRVVTAAVPRERLGLGADDHLKIGDFANRRHYFLLKAELAGKVGNEITEQDANSLLFAAYNILSPVDVEAMPGAVFIDRLKRDPAYLTSPARQAAVNSIVEKQRRLKKRDL